MKRLLVLTLLSMPCYGASWHAARHAAAAAVCASQAADVATSWRDSHIPGLHESNPLYSSMGRMVVIKAAICGGFVVSQHLHGHDALWTVAGASIAAPTVWAAVHNTRLAEASK